MNVKIPLIIVLLITGIITAGKKNYYGLRLSLNKPGHLFCASLTLALKKVIIKKLLKVTSKKCLIIVFIGIY